MSRGHVPQPRREPTALEYDLADAVLRPIGISFDELRDTPRDVVARRIVSYREGILEMLEALERQWHEDGLETYGARKRPDAFAIELREAIDVVRGLVPGREVRPVVLEEYDHERSNGTNQRARAQRAIATDRGRQRRRRWWLW